MSLNGSGIFNVNSTGQPVVGNTTISASVFNAFTADVATALSTALYKDGQATTTARIPFGSGISVFGVNLDGSGGAGQVGFLQAGTGATATTAQAKMRQFISVMDFGATGDGSTNDRASIPLAEAAGYCFFPKGTYAIASNLTITGDMFFASGAKLKPASGVTITVTGSIYAGIYQIFDTSAGGHVSLVGAKANCCYPEWWGVIGGDGSFSSGNAATNKPLIDEILTYGSFEIHWKQPGFYCTTGHTMTIAHKFVGLGISAANAIYGSGIVFSDNAFMVSQGALLADKKYVFQNGVGSDCPVFEDISVIGNSTDCIPLGILPSSTQVLNWQCHAYRSKFTGYIGKHLAWANWNTWEACFFEGNRAPVAHTSWNDTTGAGSACYVQKQNYVGCLFSQTQQASGNIFLQNRDGDANPGSLAISNNSFTSCNFEGGFNGLYLMGREQNFVACHLENLNGTYWVSGESTTYDSLWQNPSCNTGAGTLTGDLFELLQDIGSRSSVFPLTSTVVTSLTGCAIVPTSTIRYTIIPGAIQFVQLDLQAVGGISNSVTKTLTTLPTWLRPAGDRVGIIQVSDNGGAYVVGACIVKTTGVIELYASINFAAWTAAGTATIQNGSITYSLD